jgi:hypothetical protein
MSTFIALVAALNVCAVILAGIRANNLRIEEERFWREYKAQNPEWAPRS